MYVFLIVLIASYYSSPWQSEYNQGYKQGIAEAIHDSGIIPPMPTTPDQIDCDDNASASFCDGYTHGYAVQENKLAEYAHGFGSQQIPSPQP